MADDFLNFTANYDRHVLKLDKKEKVEVPAARTVVAIPVPDGAQHISMMTIIHYIDVDLDLDLVIPFMLFCDGMTHNLCFFAGIKEPEPKKDKPAPKKKSMGFGMYDTYEVFRGSHDRCTVRLFHPKKGEPDPENRKYMIHMTGIKSYDHARDVGYFMRWMLSRIPGACKKFPGLVREATELINNNLSCGYRLRLKQLRDILVERHGLEAEYHQEGQLMVKVSEPAKPGAEKNPTVIVYSTGKFNVIGAKSMANLTRFSSFYYGVLHTYRDVLEQADPAEESTAPSKT